MIFYSQKELIKILGNLAKGIPQKICSFSKKVLIGFGGFDRGFC
jgi:hypothetical protein